MEEEGVDNPAEQLGIVANEEIQASNTGVPTPTPPKANEKICQGKPKEKPIVKKRRLDKLTQAATDVCNVARTLQNEQHPENEFEIFGNLVSVSLQMLPLPQALSAQHEIQGILMKYRLNALHHQAIP